MTPATPVIEVPVNERNDTLQPHSVGRLDRANNLSLAPTHENSERIFVHMAPEELVIRWPFDDQKQSLIHGTKHPDGGEEIIAC